MYWGSPQTPTTVSKKPSIHDLARSSPGSAKLDLPALQHAIITPEDEDTLISTGIYGPLLKESMGLIIGRSSSSTAGIQILPGVIDADYTGEIKICYIF